MDAAYILNVDDYAPGRYSRSQLLRQSGFTVYEARSGAEALQKMSLGPAVVLLDVNLPDIDGLEVCRRIRANPETASTIIVHVTASRYTARDCIVGLENGADLYLNEPIDGEVLVATINALLRAHRAELGLRRSNESLQSLTHMLSHELRQSLRGLILPAELLDRRLRTRLGPEDREILNQMLTSGRRMNQLIEGVLRYARAEHEGFQMGDISASSALRSSLNELKLLIEESGAKVEYDDLPNVRGNEVSLARVFSNLIVNSIKYCGTEPPRIAIEATQSADFCRFAVRDNGVGIAPEYHDQIFRAFKRLHGAGYEGVGIGLSLCKRLIENSGGEIWVESEAGKGATFYFTLPPAEGRPASDETPEQQARSEGV